MQQFRYQGLGHVTLEQFLTGQFPRMSRGACNKYLRENKIKLNGKKQPLSTALCPGDEVKLFVADELLEQPTGQNSFLFAGRCPEILYEDERLLAADKPAGLETLDESGEKTDTLENRILKYLYEKGEYDPAKQEFVPEPCHRLDTGTSGVVLFAKDAAARDFLTQLIKERRLQKEYLCVTFGRPKPEKATLGGYLTKDSARGVVRITPQAVSDASRPVETRYETMAVSGRLALLRVQLITGRTHQIRAHMASIGCPVLGDSKYGSNAANRELKTKYQTLCAWKLTFPVIEEPEEFKKYSGLSIQAPKPWYCAQVLDGTLR